MPYTAVTGDFFMQTELERKTLNNLCLMEEVANIYARLLIEPSLSKEMEDLARRHRERRSMLEGLLYGKPMVKESESGGTEK